MSEPNGQTRLRPVMGFLDLVLFFVIANFSLIWVVRAAEAGAAGLTLWLFAAGLFYVPLAAAVLALSARFPGEGGLYLWTREAFGEFVGFMTGWAYWACILPFLPVVLYFIAGSALYLGGGDWDHLRDSPMYFIAVSLAGLAVATVLNLVGLDVGKWLHNVGALGAWLPAVGLIVLGFTAWARHGPGTDFAAANFVPTRGLQDVLLWSFLAFGLTGLEAVPVLGDEIRDARRMPAALKIAAVLTVATNLAATAAVLAAPPAREENDAAAFMKAYTAAEERSGLAGFAPAIAALIVVGYVGKVGAWTATGARLPFVAGVGRRLPAAFARLHPRWGTPFLALYLQAAIVAILIVLGQAGTTTKGAFDVLQRMTLIPTFIPFLLMFAAAVKFERTRPAGLLSAAGILSTLVALAVAVIPAEGEENPVLYLVKVVGLAVVLLGAGVVVYLSGPRDRPKS